MTLKGLTQNGETYQYDLWLNEKLPHNVGTNLSWPTQWTKNYMIKIPNPEFLSKNYKYPIIKLTLIGRWKKMIIFMTEFLKISSKNDYGR